MPKQKFAFLRMFAVLAALTFVITGMVASPASAQSDSGIAAPCQVVGGGEIVNGQSDQDCENLIFGALPAGCDLIVEDDTFQFIGTDCANIQQGECPGNIILNNGTVIQFHCAAGGLVPTPTATSVPPTATATDVPPTATDVPPTATATDVPPTSTGTVTATATATATTTDTDTETDTDTVTDKVTDKDTDVVVAELPTTGQGPDNGQTGAVVLVLGALSMVLAGAAFAWQRRGVA